MFKLQLTVKLTPVDPRNTTNTGVLTPLEAEKLHPEDMLGLDKVSQKDTTYQVFLASDTALNFLLEKGHYKRQIHVFCNRMSEQVVKVKVHWLPLIYYDNRIVKAMLCD